MEHEYISCVIQGISGGRQFYKICKTPTLADRYFSNILLKYNTGYYEFKNDEIIRKLSNTEADELLLDILRSEIVA